MHPVLFPQRTLLLAAIIAGSPFLYGQAASPGSTVAVQPAAQPQIMAPVDQRSALERSYTKKVSYGIRASYIHQSTMLGGAYSDPLTLINSTPANQKFGGGLTVEFGITRRVGATIDFMYRMAGYDSTIQKLAVGTAADVSTTTERTRTRYYDLPVLVRYRPFLSSGMRSHVFVEAGGTLRRVSHLRSDQFTIDPAGVGTFTNTPAPIAHKLAKGVTAGAGLRFVDDFGIKFTPTFRYTRWLDQSLTVGPSRSRKDQMEATIGFTF
jgi:hypothetical protein